KSTCYKHEGNSVHGVSSGSSVTLNEFIWGNGHWERLVLKSGTVNDVFERPTAGQVYNTISGKDVSHWIVCKGVAPVVPPVEEPEEPVVPEKPADIVVHGAWGTGSIDCETRTAVVGRWVW